MGFLLPETRTEEKPLGELVRITSSRQLESYQVTPEQARQILNKIREGSEVVVQPFLRVEVTYPSTIQRKRGARQLYLGKSVSKTLRVL